jgi:4-hydroxybutyrate CoA-transferase
MQEIDESKFLDLIKSGSKIYVHAVPSTPQYLLKIIASNSDKVGPVSLYHEEISGVAPYFNTDKKNNIRDVSLFLGRNMREAYKYGLTQYLPIFLSDIPKFVENTLKPDIVLVSISPSDRHGLHSLGAAVIAIKAAIKSSPVVIAQINESLPRTFGDATVPEDFIDYSIQHNEPIHEEGRNEISNEEMQIGENVAALVPDGATLQAGIGAIPDAVMKSLVGHRDLGIHTEMFSDGMLGLTESGAVTNMRKDIDIGHAVATFAKGSKKLYNFLNDNPQILMKSVDYTNDTSNIRKQKNMISVNSAVAVDLTGQVCAESIGDLMISGVGGQMDFVRGAALSPGGKSIIALTSRTKSGKPKIASSLLPGSGVTTTRNHVQWVVTEFGAVSLQGLDLGERARKLISIAHPDDRDRLTKEAMKIYPAFVPG